LQEGPAEIALIPSRTTTSTNGILISKMNTIEVCTIVCRLHHTVFMVVVDQRGSMGGLRTTYLLG